MQGQKSSLLQIFPLSSRFFHQSTYVVMEYSCLECSSILHLIYHHIILYHINHIILNYNVPKHKYTDLFIVACGFWYYVTFYIPFLMFRRILCKGRLFFILGGLFGREWVGFDCQYFPFLCLESTRKLPILLARNKKERGDDL